MVELQRGFEYFTSKGLLEYCDTDTKGMSFKVKGYRARVHIQNLKDVYADSGYKYYKSKNKFVTPEMAQIRAETARFITTGGDYFPYPEIAREDMESIEYGTNEDPYKRKVYLIGSDNRATGLVPEYFTNEGDAQEFYEAFERECEAKGMIGYTEAKDRVWRKKLAETKEAMENELAQLEEKILKCRSECEQNYESMLKILLEQRITSFEQAKEWSQGIIERLEFYDELREGMTTDLTKIQADKIAEVINEEKRRFLEYLEDRRIYYGQISNTDNKKLDEELSRLEEQQNGMRSQILKKQDEVTAQEFEILNSTEPETKEEIDQQMELLEKIYTELEKAMEMADKYQQDIEKEVEEILKTVNPSIYKAWALDELHYTDNRW